MSTEHPFAGLDRSAADPKFRVRHGRIRQSIMGWTYNPMPVPELARLASPVFHVDRSDPPLLLLHGDQDPQMPINQAHELSGAYQKLGLPVRLEVVHGAAHGGAAFYDAERLAVVKAFLARFR